MATPQHTNDKGRPQVDVFSLSCFCLIAHTLRFRWNSSTLLVKVTVLARCRVPTESMLNINLIWLALRGTFHSQRTGVLREVCRSQPLQPHQVDAI